MKTLRLTDQEIAAMRGMLDVALRQLGGQAAQTFLVLDSKLQMAQGPDTGGGEDQEIPQLEPVPAPPIKKAANGGQHKEP